MFFFNFQGDQTPHPNLNKEKIKRWDYKEKLREKELNPNHKIVEPDGCGKPICTIIDQRPIRYSLVLIYCAIFFIIDYFI